MKKIYSSLLLSFFVLTTNAQSWNVGTGPSGIPLHTNLAGAQVEQSLCVTSVRDGIIYVWRDNRTGSNGQDIYAQKYTLCGTPVWAATGVLICNAPANQTIPQICPDGSDGAIITWDDNRIGNDDIYAQHINGQGLTQWLLNGVVISNGTGNQQIPQIISDGNGGAIIAWEDNRSGNYDIYAQRVTSAGAMLWTANGAQVCVTSGNQNDLALATDSANGCFITWEDNRPTNLGVDIYAQHMNPSGTPLWTANGLQLTTNSGNQTDPCVANTMGGTATFAWAEPSGVGQTINALKLNSLGTALPGWNLPNGNIAGNAITESTNPGTASRPKIAADKVGGCYISYRSNYSSGDKDILTSWMNANGTPNACQGNCISNVEITAFSTDVEDNHDITADGCGGAVNTFEQRNAPTIVGYRKYSTSTIYASQGTGTREIPFITALCGIEYLVWQDQRTGTLGGDDLYIGGTSSNSPPALLNCSLTPTLPNNSCCAAPMNANSCFGSTVVFTVALPGGLFNSFTFYDGNTVIQTGSSNVLSTSSLSVGPHAITVVAATASGCSTNSSNIINITVLALPNIQAFATNTTICAGDPVSINAVGGVSYIWNPGNLTGSSVVVFPSTSTTYTVTGTDANGCSNTATMPITVNPLPNVSMNAQSTATCVTLNVDPLTGTPSGGTFSGTGVSGNNFDPSAAGTGTFTITYTFTDVNGCTNTATTQITVNSCTGIEYTQTPPAFDIYPNPFSDAVTVEFGQADVYKVEICNVVGEIVYSSTLKTQHSDIHLGQLGSGVYFIKVSSGSGSTTKKIVKE